MNKDATGMIDIIYESITNNENRHAEIEALQSTLYINSVSCGYQNENEKNKNMCVSDI